jgi:RNA ligase
MFYQFIPTDDLSDYLEAIKGCEEFIIKRDEENGYCVLNYLINYSTTFTDPNSTDDLVLRKHYTLRRECRGLKFSLATGKIISRPYHKFFNLNEKPETEHTKIDFTQEHLILEKLDGSMLTPMLINDRVRWATKMGLTDVAKPVELFVTKNTVYEVVAKHWINLGYTPIFEWCSRQQRIVIDYPEERLVLTAIRNNLTGEYIDYAFMLGYGNSAGIPVVKALPGSVTNIQEFMKQVHDLEGAEGYVIRFKNGMMLKIKGAEYCLLHKTLDACRFEKDVIRLIIDEKIDDTKAFLPDDLKNAIDRFSTDIYKNTLHLADKIYWQAQAAYDNLNGSKKRFALEVVNADDFGKKYSKFLFLAFDRLDEEVDGVYKNLLAHVLLNTSSQTRVNENRHIFGGITWYDYAKTPDLDP